MSASLFADMYIDYGESPTNHIEYNKSEKTFGEIKPNDMKAYTDLEQSKKLLEILPLESADGYWFKGFPPQPYMVYTKGTPNPGEHIPCWSLAALLGILPEPQLIQNSDGRWMLRIWDKKRFPWSVGGNVNPVDACYEMIIKLNEQNLFKKLLEEQQ